MSTQDGVDRQCAFNRSKRLCGSCKEGLSVSFGGSHCVKCSNYWLTLLFPFALAGALLVFILLLLNLTVASGTINGLVFYANVVAANRSVFLTFDKQNILTVFIGWLNLDLGLEVCFYNGMDAYAKTWLQFTFPLFIFALVIAVIKGCKYSRRLSQLLLDKNPVATLATLILFSYTKLLRIIIAAMSYAYLTLPDGTYQKVWLIDANVQYLKGKHVALFLAAVIVLVLGVAYTLVLLLWQWIMFLSNKRAFKWILTNSKLFSFMDAYHAPYTPKHRYWTGLLLTARVQLYLISAFNVLGDHRIDLLAIICTTAGLIVLKTLGGKRYKKNYLDFLETSFLLNLLILAAATLYNWETNGNQIALTCISVTIAFVTFSVIVLYHLYVRTAKMCITYITKFKHKCQNKDTTLEMESILSMSDTYEIEHELTTPVEQELIVIDSNVYLPSEPNCTPINENENQSAFE